MTSRRKRTIRDVEEDDTKAQLDTTAGSACSTAALSLLTHIRNLWEFAALVEFIYLFGSAIKIDNDIDVETLEEECVKPGHSQKLSEIGLALLKYVSSHKGLTLEIFDEFARRQYMAKAPQRNPFGEEEQPNKFSEFDIFMKIRVLQQLSTWTLYNSDRVREKMGEKDETQWRIEPLGWDAKDRTYFVLDDNRLYRKADPKPGPVKPQKSKAKAKPKSRGSRASKRQRLSNGKVASVEEESDNEETPPEESADNGLGGATWECVAITLEEYNKVLESIRSKNADEKILSQRIRNEVLPEIEKAAEARAKREAKRMKDLENMQKMATAKRSSRLADKQEKQKEVEAAAEAEQKKQAEFDMARKEQERQRKMEEDRETRMMTREQRLKDREMKRILHEEELAKLEERSKSVEAGEARLSERNRKAQLEKTQQEVERLKREMSHPDEHWDFDCSICGVHGPDLDDGTHILACEKCNVWQHCACHGIEPATAERDDFHFICSSCSKPKFNSIKLNYKGDSSSSQQKKPLINAGPTTAASTSNNLQKSTVMVPTNNDSPPSQQTQLSPHKHISNTNATARQEPFSNPPNNLAQPSQPYREGQTPAPSAWPRPTSSSTNQSNVRPHGDAHHQSTINRGGRQNHSSTLPHAPTTTQISYHAPQGNVAGQSNGVNGHPLQTMVNPPVPTPSDAPINGAPPSPFTSASSPYTANSSFQSQPQQSPGMLSNSPPRFAPPSSNQPNPAGMSPTKHQTLPSQPSNSPPRFPPPSSMQTSPAGISPTKHQTSSPPQPSHTPPLASPPQQQPGMTYLPAITPVPSPAKPVQATPGSQTGSVAMSPPASVPSSLPPAPQLSPSVGMHGASGDGMANVPVKKMTPLKGVESPHFVNGGPQ
ncbi:MAG: hypothetical protein M1831_003034 [Alyxoria varia]|nr:MAG: hypothetical protein M1831_003034 [Alyxoria varia]